MPRRRSFPDPVWSPERSAPAAPASGTPEENRYRRQFETAQVGILLVDAETGEIKEANAYLVEMLPPPDADCLGRKFWDVDGFKAIMDTEAQFRVRAREDSVRTQTMVLRTRLERDLDIEFVTNSFDCDGGRVMQCVLRDVTVRTQAITDANRLSRLYAALSRANRAIVKCRREEDLFPEVCRAAFEVGGLRTVWIGIIDSETSLVNEAASFGEGAEYSLGLQISVDPTSPFGNGPTAIAIRERRPYWCDDFALDPATVRWRERAKDSSLGAFVSLPLYRGGIVMGVLSVGFAETNCLDVRVRSLFLELAADISFAIDGFANSKRNARAEADMKTAQQTFQLVIENAVAGILIIRDGAISYANQHAADILGFATTAGLIGADPIKFADAADRGKLDDLTRQLLEGDAPYVAFEFAATRQDGRMIRIGVTGVRAVYEGLPAIISMFQDVSQQEHAAEDIRRYVAQLRTALMSTIELATSLSEMRDPYTAGHERRVAKIAVAIGTELGCDADRIEGLRIAGLLHDIGKMTIPTEILSKPGALTTLQFQMIQEHPQTGHDALLAIDFPWPIQEMVLQHHERMDGTGYPRHLKGEAIQLEARILGVADVVEAMSSHRPYRAALGIDAALAEIERGRGTRYDRAVTDACLRLFRVKGFHLSAHAGI